MDIQKAKEAFPEISQESIMLGDQAVQEQEKFGRVLMVCPKCQEHPQVIVNEHRTIAFCGCGHVKYGEIHF